MPEVASTKPGAGGIGQRFVKGETKSFVARVIGRSGLSKSVCRSLLQGRLDSDIREGEKQKKTIKKKRRRAGRKSGKVLA